MGVRRAWGDGRDAPSSGDAEPRDVDGVLREAVELGVREARLGQVREGVDGRLLRFLDARGQGLHLRVGDLRVRGEY